MKQKKVPFGQYKHQHVWRKRGSLQSSAGRYVDSYQISVGFFFLFLMKFNDMNGCFYSCTK